MASENKEPTSTEGEVEEKPAGGNISKRQQKRLAKQARKDMYKRENRLKERERKKERRRKIQEEGGVVESRKSLKHNTMANSKCRQRIAVDCSFDDLMSEKDVKDLSGQLARCYSINRRLEEPVQFHIVAANGDRSQRTIDRLNVLNQGNWDVHMETGDESKQKNLSSSEKPLLRSSVLNVFNKDEVVYLTSESPNVLETLDESKVYIIGGLVDHNAHKGLTFKMANEMGIAHAQLPIAQYITMLHRKVLTVCHVFEILVKHILFKDWQRAMLDTLPKRHSVEAVSSEGGDNPSSSSETTTATTTTAPKTSLPSSETEAPPSKNESCIAMGD